MRFLRSRHLIVFALAAMPLAALGCGSEDSSGAGGSDGLAGALADVHVTSEQQPFYFSWVDTARMREASGLADSAEEASRDERWRTPVGYALGDKLATQFQVVDYGFDPIAGDRTVEVGQPPRAASRYDGVDADAAKSAFEDLGFEDSGDFLALGDEAEIVQDAVDENGVGPVGINRVATDGDSLALGAYEDDVSAALGRSGDPASDVAGASAIADCMGDDAFVALIIDPEEGASDEVSLTGFGLEASGSGEADEVPEVICAAGEDGGSLDDVSTCMDSAFNDGGTDPVTGEDYATRLGEAEIEEGDSDGTPWVRATFSPPDADAPIGLVLEMAQNRAFTGPLGGDVASSLPNTTPEQIEALGDQGCAAG